MSVLIFAGTLQSVGNPDNEPRAVVVATGNDTTWHGTVTVHGHPLAPGHYLVTHPCGQRAPATRGEHLTSSGDIHVYRVTGRTAIPDAWHQ